MKKILIIVFVLVVLFFIQTRPVKINSFEECAQRYPVMESYPEQCRTPSGDLFVRDIGNELEKTDLIIVDYPRPGQKITSPLIISGQARGYWFFEGDFPVELRVEDEVIAVGIAETSEEWMTEDFIDFSAELVFETEAKKGDLFLLKDNPSGQDYDYLRIPVVFNEN